MNTERTECEVFSMRLRDMWVISNVLCRGLAEITQQMPSAELPAPQTQLVLEADGNAKAVQKKPEQLLGKEATRRVRREWKLAMMPEAIRKSNDV